MTDTVQPSAQLLLKNTSRRGQSNTPTIVYSLSKKKAYQTAYGLFPAKEANNLMQPARQMQTTNT